MIEMTLNESLEVFSFQKILNLISWNFILTKNHLSIIIGSHCLFKQGFQMLSFQTIYQKSARILKNRPAGSRKRPKIALFIRPSRVK